MEREGTLITLPMKMPNRNMRLVLSQDNVLSSTYQNEILKWLHHPRNNIQTILSIAL